MFKKYIFFSYSLFMEKKNKKKIKWDYKKIEEQNILRGTRLKINESKTPKKSNSNGSLNPFRGKSQN